MNPQAKFRRWRIFDGAHRLLFLCAAVHAAIVPLVWLLPEAAVPSPSAFHSRQLVFGTTWAAIGGYVLTALASWNKGYRPSAWTSVVATFLWLFDRAEPWIAPSFINRDDFNVPDVFPIFLLTFAAFHMPKGSKRSGWAVLFIILVIWMARFVAVASSAAEASQPTLMVDIILICALITLIGSRAFPAFAKVWQPTDLPSYQGRWGRGPELAAIAVLILASAAYEWGEVKVTGLLLLLAAAVIGQRTMTWHWKVAFAYPALLMLFIAWAWLPIGIALCGASMLADAPTMTVHFIHALAIGAVASSIYAMMARPAMRRIDGKLIVGYPTLVGFTLVQLATITRVFVAQDALVFNQAIAATAIAWFMAWCFFLLDYAPSLLKPPPHPVFSAVRKKSPQGPAGPLFYCRAIDMRNGDSQ